MTFVRQLAALSALAALFLALSGSVADARRDGGGATKPRVVFLTENVGCAGPFLRLVCDGFLKAVRRTDVEGRIVTPTARENLVDTLSLLAKQRYDVVFGFGDGYPEAMSVVAARHPDARFALIDRSYKELTGRPRNVQGIVFRTSEAAYVAGWLAGRMEQRRPGRDVVGIVAGIPIPSVEDFLIGFRAGVRRVSPRIRVLTAYSNNFLDASTCAALARHQVAQGAGVLFNVAGVCGLGTLEVAEERGIWGIGVDTDQSFLGPHILTSVLKHFDSGFVALLRRVKGGHLSTGSDTVLTLRDGAVGLGKISRRVPVPLRTELVRLERRIVSGRVRVPGAFPNPR